MQKTVNGVVTKYTLHGKNVVHMTQGSNELHFFYDAQNRPAVVVYNGTAYAYAKNLQGDIVGILDNAGNWVVEYTYDAWGAPISRTGSMADTLGVINPFRYRGYVYDQETGLYYLRSRYYNPSWCRFVNADTCLGEYTLLSHNSYAYCSSSPIKNRDQNGFAFACCFDANGNEATYMSMTMGGGFGGGAVMAFVISAGRNMTNEEWGDLFHEAVITGITFVASSYFMKAAFAYGNAIRAACQEAQFGVVYGDGIGRALHAIVTAGGLLMTNAVSATLHHTAGLEYEVPSEKNYAIDLAHEYSPFKLPSFLEGIITCVEQLLDYEKEHITGK